MTHKWLDRNELAKEIEKIVFSTQCSIILLTHQFIQQIFINHLCVDGEYVCGRGGGDKALTKTDKLWFLWGLFF